MTDRVARLTKDTLIPIGVVAAVVILVWNIATERQEARARMDHNTTAIESNAEAIRGLRTDMTYLTRAMLRVEGKLGTLPEGQTP
ncbi:MAG: hypothetical protein ACE5E6_09415 [Phycisphaerae bacterium]